MSQAGHSVEQRGAGSEDPSDISDAVRHGRGATNTATVGHRRQRFVDAKLVYFLQQDGDRHHDSGTATEMMIVLI